MFKRIDNPHDDSRLPISFTFEGQTIYATDGDTVAAALLANGITSFRTTSISDSARGPHCMMGVCFECLVSVDGQANRQGCLVQVRNGMQVTRQHGARTYGS